MIHEVEELCFSVVLRNATLGLRAIRSFTFGLPAELLMLRVLEDVLLQLPHGSRCI